VHCTQGLAVLATLPETQERAAHELRLQVRLGFAQMAMAGSTAPSAERAFERALELCPQVDDTPHALMALRGLSNVYFFQGKPQHAQAVAAYLLRLSQRVGDQVHCQHAHLRLGQIACSLGHLTVARTHEEQALVLTPPSYDRHGIEMGVEMEVEIRINLALCLWLLGYADQARAQAQEALVLARTRAHPLSLAHALEQAAHIQAHCGAWSTVQAHADVLLTLATEQGLAWFRAYALHSRGYALAAQGHTAAGLAQMHQGLAALQDQGDPVQPYAWACLAEAYGWNGQVEAGLAVLADSLAHIYTRGRRIGESRLYRVRGELLLTRAAEQPQAEAERCFHHALAIARQQQARGLELQAALRLSRLWQHQGKCTAARKLLAEIYSWFTEGFDTADLQEAKALLQELQ
jgi:tetratricopeptide (TPR) repeat protein